MALIRSTLRRCYSTHTATSRGPANEDEPRLCLLNANKYEKCHKAFSTRFAPFVTPREQHPNLSNLERHHVNMGGCVSLVIFATPGSGRERFVGDTTRAFRKVVG